MRLRPAQRIASQQAAEKQQELKNWHDDYYIFD